MKGRYVVDADQLLAKSLGKLTSSDAELLQKAIKIRLLKEYVKDEGVVINKSFALLRMLSDE